jgi:UvrD-like helicase C-terminal domain
VRTGEDEQVNHDFAELDELARAYAVTIHRSQGSAYPAVIIPLTTSARMMLRRNLPCTGITRARKLIIPAGSRRALAHAVRTPAAGRRHTALTCRLPPAGQASPPSARQPVTARRDVSVTAGPHTPARSTRPPPDTAGRPGRTTRPSRQTLRLGPKHSRPRCGKNSDGN